MPVNTTSFRLLLREFYPTVVVVKHAKAIRDSRVPHPELYIYTHRLLPCLSARPVGARSDVRMYVGRESAYP